LDAKLVKQLHINGYCVVKHCLKWDPAQLTRLQKTVNKGAIFNNSGKNDLLRRQKEIQPIAQMDKVLQKWFPGKLLNTWFLLYSVGGCKQQIPHTDYSPGEHWKRICNENVPLAALTTLSPRSKLVVWPGNIRFAKVPTMQEAKVLHYKRGDLVLFRGDLVHAGAAFEKDNFRIHVYLDSAAVPRVVGKTFKMDI
jgi:hypothetical protein